MIGSKISLIAGIIQALFFYRNLNIEKPNLILQNWPFLIFLIFAIVNFLYFRFLDKNIKQGKVIKYSIFVSIFLLILPFILYYLIGVYFAFKAYQMIKGNLPEPSL